MRVLGIPLIPAVMGLVLGPLGEQELRRALAIGEGALTVRVTRAISGTLLATVVALFLDRWLGGGGELPGRRWKTVDAGNSAAVKNVVD